MTRRAASLVLIGLLAMIAAPAQAEPTATLYLDGNVGGDVETDRGGAGLALGYYYRGRIGLELDVAYQFHFFKDEDVADLVPERVDLNTRAITAMANVVAPIPIPRAPIWLPYGSAGLGAVHAIFAADGSDELDRTQTNLAFNVGVGMKHRLTELVGLQVEGRYFRVLVDEDSTTGGYFEDYDMWRVSVGVTFGFPTALPRDLR
jgi:opacity protein-like surface antigen